MIPPIASKFVAGETAPEAIDHLVELNDDDLAGILNLLGEHYTDPDKVADEAATYRQLIRDIAREDLDGCISVKPTQLGLDIGEDVFRKHLDGIIDVAIENDVFVWIDMERSETTDATLQAYESMAERHPRGVGVCLQSNLRRTADDIERLADVPGKIRIVKGAYQESAEVAYQGKQRVDEAYRADLERLFRTHDWGVAVGSHDPEMIQYAKQLHDVHGTPMEIQMLMGVRESAQRDLQADGYRVYQYVPYGSAWFDYFRRRVFERTENLTFALRALFGD